jgi:hypothetical protein
MIGTQIAASGLTDSVHARKGVAAGLKQRYSRALEPPTRPFARVSTVAQNNPASADGRLGPAFQFAKRRGTPRWVTASLPLAGQA